MNIIKHLWIACIIACLMLGLWLYLYDSYEPVEASEPSEKMQAKIEALYELEENREERKVLRVEIDERVQRVKELEARANELNITINGEGFE